MERHGDEVTECLSLQLCQGHLSQLVLDVKPVVVTVLRQAPVAQQCPYKDCLLSFIEIESISNFPRRYPLHPIIVMTGCDRTFTDIAGLIFISLTAEEDKISYPVCSPSFRASVSAMAQDPAFATGVPPDICAFHRYTRNSRSPYHALVCKYRMASQG